MKYQGEMGSIIVAIATICLVIIIRPPPPWGAGLLQMDDRGCVFVIVHELWFTIPGKWWIGPISNFEEVE